MDDHSFGFFAQLLKNVLRKFSQMGDMISAKLVCSITQRILRCKKREGEIAYRLGYFSGCWIRFMLVFGVTCTTCQ